MPPSKGGQSQYLLVCLNYSQSWCHRLGDITVHLAQRANMIVSLVPCVKTAVSSSVTLMEY